MAESRSLHLKGIFRSKNVDDVKASARKKDQTERNFKSAVSLGMEKASLKIKKLFHNKVASRAVSKETQPSIPQETATSSRQQKSSFKKPPFIVPGRIRHNDLHLIQALPAQTPKIPPKKLSKPPPNVKSSASHQLGAINKQPASVKSIATAVVKPRMVVLAPETQDFRAPTEIKADVEISAPYNFRKIGTHEVELHTQSPQNVCTTPLYYRSHPWITAERTCSAQKPFTSLLGVEGSPAPHVSFFEDCSDDDGNVSSCSEDSTEKNDSSQSDDEKEHRNENYSATEENNDQNHHEVANEEDHGISLNKYGAKEVATVKKDKVDEKNGTSVLFKKIDLTPKKRVGTSSPTGSPMLNQVDEIPVKDVSDGSSSPTISPLQLNLANETPVQEIDSEKMEIAGQLRLQIDQTKVRLDKLCGLWSELLEKDDTIPNEEIGAVLTVVGQTQQLQRERFNQFSDLIVKFQYNSGPKKIIKSDLEGFWEMILLQVTDVENKFTELDRLHRTGWMRQEVSDSQENKQKKLKKPKKKNEKKKCDNDGIENRNSGLRSHIATLRKKHVESMPSNTVNCHHTLSDHHHLHLVPEKSLEIGDSEDTSVRLTKTDHPSTPKQGISQLFKGLGKRMKHNSATFFSPIIRNSPRPRSYSTDCLVDQLPNLHSPALSEKNLTSSPLTVSALFPTVKRNVEHHQCAEKHEQANSPRKEENNNDSSFQV